MIQVAGVPIQANSQLNVGSTERAILQKMQKAGVQYSYPSINALMFELKTRKNIVESAIDMNDGEARFTTFEYARCNTEYWNLTEAGGFRLKNNVQPSTAIRDIYTNSSQYAFDCATACVIIFYYAILNSVGDRVFNRLFQELYLYSWHTDPDLGLNTFYGDHFLPGDVIYINNPEFSKKTPWFRGINAVVLDDNTLFGHGFEPWTAEQMIQFLNENRKPDSNQSAYVTNLVSRPSFNHLFQSTSFQREIAAYKKQTKIVHHNKPSLSCFHYLYFLTKTYKM